VGLREYRDKRRFDETPEPKGGRSSAASGLRFVVQKHQASHLHYDFRLEVDGVLKSWAVPKGPSLDPTQKRLAMHVEDHPFDYRDFEGTIPPGNYGAGTVMVWDQGEVTGVSAADRKGSEKELRDGLQAGRLSFMLHGEKLRGEFSLVRLAKGGEKSWLLIKKRDEHATENDVLEQDRSVVTGRSLEEISHGKAPPKGKATAKPLTAEKPLPKAQGSKFVSPMLATLVDEPFDRPGWIFEIKWDGYRAIAETTSRSIRLYSRNHKSFEERFAPVVVALRSLKRTAVLDGEIVALDEHGRSSFQLLQNYQKTGQGRLQFAVFDLLKLDRKDLRKKPLLERKAILADLVKSVPGIMLSEHVAENGTAFFEAAREQGLEGVIGKDGASPYREGTRSGEWVKIKTHQRQEAVIGGYTEPRGGRTDLGALVLGVYEGGDLVYIGHTGGGFNAGSLADVRKRLEKLVRKTCPFKEKPATNAPAEWVAPKLVCEVKFQEWTEDGRMRQPIFIGLREDKDPLSVKRERPQAVRGAKSKATPAKGKKSSRPAVARKKVTGRDSIAKSSEPNLTNLQKLYWPDDGITKGDLIEYYREVSEFILPHLRDRPQSLNRHPNGIKGPNFYQKDVSRQPPPEWVETVDLHSESTNENVKFIVCQNKESLLYIANLGCIELNPWHSRLGSLDNPDYLLIDLDPQGQPFDEVVRAAQTVRKKLDSADLPSLCKTSGKRGLHLVLPLGAKYVYEEVRQFAELVANLVNAEMPETTSVVRSPAKRRNKIYLDFLQNSRGQTVAAPYSVRPAPGATVSTPLKWSEVKMGMDPTKFTIKTTMRRLAKVGDLWKPVLGRGVDLAVALQRLRRVPKK